MSPADLAKSIAKAASRGGLRPWELFDQLVAAAHHSCAASAGVDTQRHLNAAAEAVGRVMKTEGAEAVLQDLLDAVEHGTGDTLGDTAALLGTLSKDAGQFFTPPEVCQLLNRLVGGPTAAAVETAVRTHGYMSIHEPAAGAGGMVLACADTVRDAGFDPAIHLYADAWDIELSAWQMCFVQLSLRQIPARVVLGNTLTLEVRQELHTAAYTRRFVPFQRDRARGLRLLDLIRGGAVKAVALAA